ncbi:MAG: hypothetical protein AAFR21_15820 [Pseudomonadota bacterium]
MIPAPDIRGTDVPIEYARLIAWGWDTIQEAYPHRPDGNLEKSLQEAKKKAGEARASGDGVYVMDLYGEAFQMHASAAKGFSYRFQTDDIIYLVKTGNCDWAVSVRYSAAGLWEHGWDALQAQAREFIDSMFERHSDAAAVISRADYAFDFFSPAFTNEFTLANLSNLFVCHSSSKVRWNSNIIGTSRKDQTVTIGSPARLQISVYDKAAEINEMSGKTWMEEVWAQTTQGEVLYDTVKPSDVWRLEVRMGSQYLKNRIADRGNCKAIETFKKHHRKLITDALMRVRMTALDGEACIRNRPMHPLWTLALAHIADGTEELLPIGRRVTGRRSKLLSMAEAQIAGAVRSAAVLAEGQGTSENLDIILARAKEVALADPNAAKKVTEALHRYEFVDEAK